MNSGVSEYLGSLPEERRIIVKKIIDMILELYPAADASMKYKMPTFKVGDGWVAVANQKNYVSLYTCSQNHIKAFSEKHPYIKTGKGCINFKQTDNLPLGDIQSVIKHALSKSYAGQH